ncbi:hypothetical protein JG687_00015607 [Phytophthora cactorum]|uniref:Armadillo-type fold n=1 Tax=Phytophthora cactorum TaxID=29920 RepID=A0A8T1TXG7_9STRA|nr:hypothetical protein JG687_00015607 [Phytophthora cactorum]
MSHRLSQNARHTKDLLEELERDKELDVLREYLTRFELFPRQRDPAAAPIRFEELKELAKHWKLHRQRNFWKTNTTKEDLVRTLGDLFGQRGNYEDGMIYLSRFRKPTTLLNSMGGMSSSLASVVDSNSTLINRPSKSKEEEEDEEQEPSTDALDFSTGMSREIRLKQECAFSIYHFSTIAGHERQMVTEGCMLALSKLAVFEDMEVKRFCAAAILNLLCESVLGVKMADEGVLLASLELAKAQHEEVRRHTSMALCRFSYERAGQLRLVQEGCVSAILSMLNVPDLETKEACVKALINIASASSTTVAESVVHVLMKLATRKDQTSAKFAAQAICNLSLLSGSRAKVVEEGILDTVCELAQQTSVATGSGEAEDGGDVGTVRKHLATALCNLSGLPGNLDPLSHGRILECLGELLKCEKPREVREMCAVTIANISSYPPSLKNLALSDAVANLVEIGTHHSSSSVRENTALCLSNMSATADSRALLARFGVVSLLLRFVEEDEGSDAGASALAQQFAVLTLCSMLAHPAACVEILQSNMPAAIARLAIRTPHDRVRDLCANALFNVSCEKSLHGVLLQDDTIRAIVRLCRRKGEVDDEASAFAKLASSATHRGLLTRCAELYPALTLMMRCGVEDIQIYSAVALCNLAVEPPAAKPVGVRYVWKEGTVPDFIVNALLRINSDSTKEICARALFNLLTHDELRAAHIKDGVLYALVKLARLESVEIRTLCVTALYNLSCDPALAETLMELKVAQVITKLCEMEFSSQEIHRKLAACLTNLASEPKPPGKKVSDVSASNSSSSMAVRLVESGALVALLVLCEHADPPTRHACAAALCFLSAYRVNCEAMATLGLVDVLTKKLLLAPLDAGTNSSDVELEQRQQHEYALNALCNISCYPALHDRTEEAGAVPQIIRVLASLDEDNDQEDEAMVLACVQTLANLTFHARHRRALLTHGLVPTLLGRSQSLRSPRVGDVCAEIIAVLCEDPLHWHELIATGAVRVLREIIQASDSSSVSQTALRASIYALSQLARCEKAGEAVIADGALDVVAYALDDPPGEDTERKKSLEARQEMAERCAVILRALSTQGEFVCLRLMSNVRLVPLLSAIVTTCCPGRRQIQASKHVILAFYNLTSCRVSTDDEEDTAENNGESEGMRGLDAMVISGVVPLLIRLSTDGGTDMAPACAVALAHVKHRIKERLAMIQAQEGEGSGRREFEAMDNLMEAGVVTALLAMFELDPAGIQRVDRLAAATPPALPVLRAATEKDWVFLSGNATLRYETPLPVCWDFRSSAIDDARFVPAEPRSFLSVLAPLVPASGATIQDKLFGRFQILKVRPNKCLLRLENSRFTKLATALLGGQTGSARSSASDLSDAIALAIGDGHVDEHSTHSKANNNRNRSIAGATDEDESETRMPSPVRKKPTGRQLMAMARSMSNRGSAAFGIGSNADNSPRRVSKPSSHTMARRPSRNLIHENHNSAMNSTRNLGGHKDSSHRLNSDSSGVTLPRIL